MKRIALWLALALCCLALPAVMALGAQTLPAEFDDASGWEARPSFQADPASNPEVVAADGIVTLRVSEPGLGMKFALPLRPFDSDLHTYLILRYRAENLAGGYAIWVYDGSTGGRDILNTSALTRDGQWHVAAIDLWAAGVIGSVRELLTDVRCKDAAAWMSFDYIRLTEETPNDVNSQRQDGALGYSVWNGDAVLAPHRVDLFRFVFPDFKVFQLTQYEPFTEGNWDLLKFPFFNGEGYWLGGGTAGTYDDEAHEFLTKAFAILHDNEDAFCSDDVEPLTPTLIPTVYANRFTGGGRTVWTLFNADFRTVRGDLLRVTHTPGARYLDAFTDRPIEVTLAGGMATIPLELGARRVGCVVAIH